MRRFLLVAGLFFVPFVIAWALTLLAIRLAPQFGLVDHPGTRKVHTRSTPRGGGLAIYAGVVLAALVFPDLMQREFAAVVADFAAGRDGLVTLFRLLKSQRPQTLSILIADDPDSELVASLINQAQIFRFLAKPVDPRVLRAHVASALRRYAAFKEGSDLKGGGAAAQPIARAV